MKNDRERGMRKTEEGREERRLPDEEKKHAHTHTRCEGEKGTKIRLQRAPRCARR